MPENSLSNFIFHPELKLTYLKKVSVFEAHAHCQKIRITEYCPKCATPSNLTYDSRRVRVKDAPIRGTGTILFIRKRRLWCAPCHKPFTEPVAGIGKGKRHTDRYARGILWACENFSDLTAVRRAYRASSSLVYDVYYRKLEQKVGEKVNYPWPKIVGIDEHAFKKARYGAPTEFVTMIVDHSNRRVREVVLGKTTAALSLTLAEIPGRENVEVVTLDLCDPFKNFVREFFPKAKLVADKFHVLRLLSPALLRRRKEITGTRSDLRAKKLLLMSSYKLRYPERLALHQFTERFPELHEVYLWKERLHGLYRTRGYEKAKKALQGMCDEMASSQIPEVKTLRRTLLKWREEILNYFLTGITNARTEGFNNKAKVVKRRAYGYKSFRNYRLKVLTACA
jgi:transposase